MSAINRRLHTRNRILNRNVGERVDRIHRAGHPDHDRQRDDDGR